jgi:hypothetical protein
MANATMISIDEMYLKKDQAKKPEKEFEKLSQQDLEDICNKIVDGDSSSALGNHIIEKEVDFMRDIVIFMHVKNPEFRGQSLSQLQQLSKSVDISFTPDYADHVFEQTFQQSQSEAGRIHR